MSIKMSRESRLITKILRHQLVALNIPTDNEGYVEIFNLLGRFDILKKLTLDDIKNIVETDNKGRFGLKQVNGVWFIRANQGHSKSVGDIIETDKAMKLVTVPISGVFHGSYKHLYSSILKNGLLAMGRKHIHMAKSIDAKSGKRKTCNMLVYVDMESAMKDGIKFYESENGVILSEEPIPSKFLRFESN
jgi:2'-phosphotransferase